MFTDNYDYSYLNPFHIKYIYEDSTQNITNIVMFGKNLSFTTGKSINSIISWLQKYFPFVCVDTPLRDKYYVNTDKISNIQVENYISISPEEIEYYLQENGFYAKSELFYLVFDDGFSLTILGESIEQIAKQIGGELL